MGLDRDEPGSSHLTPKREFPLVCMISDVRVKVRDAEGITRGGRCGYGEAHDVPELRISSWTREETALVTTLVQTLHVSSVYTVGRGAGTKQMKPDCGGGLAGTARGLSAEPQAEYPDPADAAGWTERGRKTFTLLLHMAEHVVIRRLCLAGCVLRQATANETSPRARPTLLDLDLGLLFYAPSMSFSHSLIKPLPSLCL
jgi:hypothetical protein